MRKTIHILTIALVAFGFLPCGFLQAQEDTINILQKQIDKNTLDIKTLKKVKVSGYIQAQTEVGQRYAELKTGANNGNYSQARDGENSNFLRYGVRRGRIKIGYTDKMVSGLFEIDVNDAGVKQRNAYVQITEPFLNAFSFKAGLFVVYFGDEVGYSTPDFEGIEKSLAIQKLFPEEKDVGGVFTFKGKTNTILDGVNIDAGFLGGSGNTKDDDGRLNFVTHLKYNHHFATSQFGIGASLYQGTTNNSDTILYSVQNKEWQAQRVEANAKNARQYFGFDAQYFFLSLLGQTNLRAEYIWGMQPSMSNNFTSPTGNTYTDKFNYKRKFAAGYLYLTHYIEHTPLALLVQYSFLDANTELKGNQITNPTDLCYQTLAVGAMWNVTNYLRLTALYAFNSNETAYNSILSQGNKNDNAFTLRLQCRF